MALRNLETAIAFIDILGFEDLIKKENSLKLANMITEKFDETYRCLEESPNISFSLAEKMGFVVRTIHFSDSIVVYVEQEQSKTTEINIIELVAELQKIHGVLEFENISSILNALSEEGYLDRIIKLLFLSSWVSHFARNFMISAYPLRGAISYGECAISDKYNSIISSAYIDAVNFEKQQEWIGISLTENAKNILNKDSRCVHLLQKDDCIVEYNVPIKIRNGSSPFLETWAVDWSSKEISICKKIENPFDPEKQKSLYESAKNKIDHSIVFEKICQSREKVPASILFYGLENEFIGHVLQNIHNPQYLEHLLSDVRKTQRPSEEVYLPDKFSLCIMSFTHILSHSRQNLRVHHGGQNGGHYELTEKTIEKCLGDFITSKTAIKNFAWASILPDFLHFENMVYHAQSRSDENGIPMNPEQDKEAFISFLKEKLSELDNIIVSYNETKNKEQILFFFYIVGIILHAVQDLSCHKGMTNPEHSRLNKNGLCPDLIPGVFEFGLDITNQFVNNILKQQFNKISKEMKQEINDYPSISWSRLPRYKEVIDYLKEHFRFSKCAIPVIEQQHRARWYHWDNKDDNDSAKKVISEEIFKTLQND